METITISGDKFWKLFTLPTVWFQKAEQLKFSASLIWKHHEAKYKLFEEGKATKEVLDEPHLYPVYSSLSGFSLENLFKGIIIKNNPELSKDGKLSKELTKYHDLNYFANLAKIDMSKNETDYCKKISDLMTGFGRYPAPISLEKLLSSMGFETEYKYKEERQIYLELYQRVTELYSDCERGICNHSDDEAH